MLNIFLNKRKIENNSVISVYPLLLHPTYIVMYPPVHYPVPLILCKIRSVHTSVTAYLKNRSDDFSETWYEVGGQKYKNRHTAAFFIKSHVFSKTAHLCENKPFLVIFGSFCDFVKKPFREYFLNFAKMCQKILSIT